ncbi:MAG: alpha-1,3-galactosidase B [Rikenellaceae bacterium]
MKQHRLLVTTGGLLVVVLLVSLSIYRFFRKSVYHLSDYGLRPNSSVNSALVIDSLLGEISLRGENAILIFEPGQYNFYPNSTTQREYYISNHDQVNPKMVGIAAENLKGLTIDGGGAEFIFHGRMLPISVVGCEDITLRNLSIDFIQPHIAQVEIIENDTINHLITYEVAPWVDFEIRNNHFVNKGDGWENQVQSCIAFDGKTRHILYRTSDIWYGNPPSEVISDRRVRVKWDYPALTVGTILALRSEYRPAPGIFIADSKDITLKNVTVHYAEGMGLLAQMSEDITLHGFEVALKENDPRYFTTQADATHFSGCKGKIVSEGGLYEGMMDDAINIHGTYLKITERISDTKVLASYMHPQAWGFRWGESGDQVQFVAPRTMELTGDQTKIKSITAQGQKEIKGAKVFEIEFTSPLDQSIVEGCGIENLEWTPQVRFIDNTIRNNRARGALFSTPKHTLIENNLFDHTSGTAILLCGDCNGWYETGACRKVIIRGNHFVNALTSMFQFTNGVISIYPEIPNLKGQTKFFHGGSNHAILIEDNTFEMFDKPILYAKSVDGLTFRSNTIITNHQHQPFHNIKVPFMFERVNNWKVEDNDFDTPFDPEKDIIVNN